MSTEISKEMSTEMFMEISTEKSMEMSWYMSTSTYTAHICEYSVDYHNEAN